MFSVCAAGHEGTWVAGGGGCTPCDPGKFNAAPDGTCSDCLAGTISTVAGATVCDACPRDEYSATDGQTSCTACVATTETTDGNTGQSACSKELW